MKNSPAETAASQAAYVDRHAATLARLANAIASAAQSAAHHTETIAIVATGKCPTCDAGLRRNSSMTGWWQCEQFGAIGFRKNPAIPSCDWQGFTS